MSTIKVTNISPQSGTEVYLTGSLIVSNILRAREVVTTISSSQVLVSGSTKFGDSADDTHVFTGSINVDGNVGIGGSVSADDYTGIFNGALSSSAQIADDISGSWTPFSQSVALEVAALTGSFSSSISSRLTTEEVNVDALQTDSGSFSTRLTNIEAFSSSLDDGYVTETELVAATASLSSSLATDIATKLNSSSAALEIAGLKVASGSLASRVTTAEAELNKTLLSGSAQIATDISGSFSSISSSLVQSISNNAAAIAIRAYTGSNTFTGDQIISSSVLLTLQPVVGTSPVTPATGSLIVSGSPVQLYIYNGSGSGWNRV